MQDPIASLRNIEEENLANILARAAIEAGTLAECVNLFFIQEDQGKFKNLIKNQEENQKAITAMLANSIMGINAKLCDEQKLKEKSGLSTPVTLSPTILMLMGRVENNAASIEKTILTQLGTTSRHANHVIKHRLHNLNSTLGNIGLATQLFSLGIGAALSIYTIVTNSTPDRRLENSLLALRTATFTPMWAVYFITGALKKFMFLSMTAGLLFSVLSSYKKTEKLKLTAENLHEETNKLLKEISNEFKKQKKILTEAYNLAKLDEDSELMHAIDTMMADITEQQQKSIHVALNAKAGAEAELQAHLANIRVTMTLNILSVPLSLAPPTKIAAFALSGAASAFSALTGSAYSRRFQIHQGMHQERIVYIGNRKLFKSSREHIAKMDYITFALQPDIADAPGSLRFLDKRVQQALAQVKNSVEFHLHLPHMASEITEDKKAANKQWVEAFIKQWEKIPEDERPRIANITQLKTRLGIALSNPTVPLNTEIKKTRLAKRFGRNIHRIKRTLSILQPAQVVLNQDALLSALEQDLEEFKSLGGEDDKLKSLFDDFSAMIDLIKQHKPSEHPESTAEAIQEFEGEHTLEFSPGVLNLDDRAKQIWLSRAAFGLTKQSEMDTAIAEIVKSIENDDRIVLMTAAHFSTENLNSVYDIRNARDGAKTELQFLNDLIKALGKRKNNIENLDAVGEKHLAFFAELDAREETIQQGTLVDRFFAKTRFGRWSKRLMNKISNRSYARSSQRQRVKHREQLLVLDHNSSTEDITQLLSSRKSRDADGRKKLYNEPPEIEISPSYKDAKKKAHAALQRRGLFKAPRDSGSEHLDHRQTPQHNGPNG